LKPADFHRRLPDQAPPAHLGGYGVGDLV